MLCSLYQIPIISNPLTSHSSPFCMKISASETDLCRLACPLISNWVCPMGSPCRRKGAQQGTVCISQILPSRVGLGWLHNHHQKPKVTAPLKVTLPTLSATVFSFFLLFLYAYRLQQLLLLSLRASHSLWFLHTCHSS